MAVQNKLKLLIQNLNFKRFARIYGHKSLVSLLLSKLEFSQLNYEYEGGLVQDKSPSYLHKGDHFHGIHHYTCSQMIL